MTPGYNSTRRNRNIGTTKSGHSRDTHFDVPEKSFDLVRRFSEQKNLKIEQRILHNTDQTITFITEPLATNYTYTLTIHDVSTILESLPPKDINRIAFIIFFQPTAKEEIFLPRWAAYLQDVTLYNTQGAAILIYALHIQKPFTWSTSLTPDKQAELERLTFDGHNITHTGRDHTITMNFAAARRTQIYSLFHEVGHHVDYTNSPRRFARKTASQKEAFAHRYTEEIHLTHAPLLPSCNG